MIFSETCSSPPSFDLSKHESLLAIYSQSVRSIKSKIYSFSSSPDLDRPQTSPTHDILSPARAAVDAAIPRAPRTLSSLLSDYFDGSENSSRHCLLLHRSIISARSLYSPLHDLFLSPHHSDRVLRIFLHFSSQPNPFDNSSTATLLLRFDDLSRKIGDLSPASFCCKTPSWRRERRTHLEKVEKGIFALRKHLETMEIRVNSLRHRLEDDRALAMDGIKYGEEDRSFMGEVVRGLGENVQLRMKNLDELEDYLCFFLNGINDARKNLYVLFSSGSSSEDSGDNLPPSN